MEVSEPISIPEPDPHQPPLGISQSPPPDPLYEPKTPPTAPALIEEFQAIVNLKEGEVNAPPRYASADDVDAGHLNGISEQKEEDGAGGGTEKEGVVQNETGKGGDKEMGNEEEIVKDGWSDDGYGHAVGSGEYGDRYKVDGWNDGNGVEEPEWKEEVQERDMQVQYPLRPGAEDCNFYMRMGSCKFGFSCKFNHPPRSRNQTGKPGMKETEDSSERPMQIECKVFLIQYNHKNGCFKRLALQNI